VCAATGDRSDKFDPGTATGSKGPRGDTAPGSKGPKGDTALELLHSGNQHHSSIIQRTEKTVEACKRCHVRSGIQ
jgi:hypothetical protein